VEGTVGEDGEELSVNPQPVENESLDYSRDAIKLASRGPETWAPSRSRVTRVGKVGTALDELVITVHSIPLQPHGQQLDAQRLDVYHSNAPSLAKVLHTLSNKYRSSLQWRF